MRADARRNYESLLASAKEIFAEYGPDAPLDDIARHAGLGNATLYRHFPTRRDLLVAVYAGEVADLCAYGRKLGDGRPAGDALFEWLRAFVEHVVSKRDLAMVERGSELADSWHSAMRSTAGALLERARETGDVRADLEVNDLLRLANGIALGGADDATTRRLLRLLREGLIYSSHDRA
ncbi:TetR/AcrR family transcriptional regulator [Fodinicola acaciae]|uniref:TetR/AcrR family transcriptional regulator n=1 Tax=Fodinicola acaciae TaxID=2681555 RepID=UPI0013D36A65|nr:TetR/AcrR family transcriptional regulator [Fodinicola acaciae]